MRITTPLLALLACAASAIAQTPVPPPQTRPLDPANMDLATSACTNFYQYANGGWLARTEMPPAFSRWGGFDELAERNRVNLRGLLERAAAERRTSSDPNTRKLGNFHAMCTDSLTADRLGATPLRPVLRRIARLRSTRDVENEIARLHNAGIPGLFAFRAAQDRLRSTDVIARTSQGGLQLPDREYYLRSDSASLALRTRYRAHIENMFVLAGESRATAAANAGAVLDLETALAQAARRRVDLRDAARNYNRMSLADAAALMPHWSWRSYLAARGRPDVSEIDVGQPEFFRAVDSLLAARPIGDWRAYLQWNAIKTAAPLLSSAFVNEDFAFDRLTTGQQRLLPRAERCVRLADQWLGQLLGQVYVREYFTPEAKASALELVQNLRAAFRERLATRAWMGDETRALAYAKLDAFVNKIGFPDVWRDYSALSLTQPSLWGMVTAARTFERARDLTSIGRPVDRTEWGMTPPTVNAYYSASLNEIAFPAGILQPPFFDPNADDAVNYGGIGAVIGHELSHGFDDQGSRFDAAGNLRNWWTSADSAGFAQLTGRVATQFDEYTVLDSVHVQGRLTLGENIGDLGGLSIAYSALQRALAGKARPVIDGFTPEQRFFLSWAQIWRQLIRPEEQRRRIATDPHAPGIWRTNGPLSNMREFAEAFSCRPGDPMVRGVDVRAEIW